MVPVRDSDYQDAFLSEGGLLCPYKSFPCVSGSLQVWATKKLFRQVRRAFNMLVNYC